MMAKIRRRLFAFLSALSLMLCAAMVVLWVRSHFRGDLTFIVVVSGHPPTFCEYFVRSNYGTLLFARNQFRDGCDPRNQCDRWDPEPLTWLSHAPSRNFSESSPFRFGGYTNPAGTAKHASVHLSHWLSAAVAAVLPALWWRGYRRHRHRRRNHLCLDCGYDLRASHDRCPECGMPIAGRT